MGKEGQQLRDEEVRSFHSFLHLVQVTLMTQRVPSCFVIHKQWHRRGIL